MPNPSVRPKGMKEVHSLDMDCTEVVYPMLMLLPGDDHGHQDSLGICEQLVGTLRSIFCDTRMWPRGYNATGSQ
eukprot:838212-Amphidinium_carterae.3